MKGFGIVSRCMSFVGIRSQDGAFFRGKQGRPKLACALFQQRMFQQLVQHWPKDERGDEFIYRDRGSTQTQGPLSLNALLESLAISQAFLCSICNFQLRCGCYHRITAHRSTSALSPSQQPKPQIANDYKYTPGMHNHGRIAAIRLCFIPRSTTANERHSFNEIYHIRRNHSNRCGSIRNLSDIPPDIR